MVYYKDIYDFFVVTELQIFLVLKWFVTYVYI
jgi:hypothetical protein